MKNTHGYLVTEQYHYSLFIRSITMSNMESYNPSFEVKYVLSFILSIVYMLISTRLIELALFGCYIQQYF